MPPRGRQMGAARGQRRAGAHHLAWQQGCRCAPPEGRGTSGTGARVGGAAAMGVHNKGKQYHNRRQRLAPPSPVVQRRAVPPAPSTTHPTPPPHNPPHIEKQGETIRRPNQRTTRLATPVRADPPPTHHQPHWCGRRRRSRRSPAVPARVGRRARRRRQHGEGVEGNAHDQAADGRPRGRRRHGRPGTAVAPPPPPPNPQLLDGAGRRSACKGREAGGQGRGKGSDKGAEKNQQQQQQQTQIGQGGRGRAGGGRGGRGRHHVRAEQKCPRWWRRRRWWYRTLAAVPTGRTAVRGRGPGAKRGGERGGPWRRTFSGRASPRRTTAVGMEGKARSRAVHTAL